MSCELFLVSRYQQRAVLSVRKASDKRHVSGNNKIGVDVSKYYAIQNKRTKRYVVRTFHVGKQRISVTEKNGAVMFDSFEAAKLDMVKRGCGNDFEVVEV